LPPPLLHIEQPVVVEEATSVVAEPEKKREVAIGKDTEMTSIKVVEPTSRQILASPLIAVLPPPVSVVPPPVPVQSKSAPKVASKYTYKLVKTPPDVNQKAATCHQSSIEFPPTLSNGTRI
jgi:hypothetical protein